MQDVSDEQFEHLISESLDELPERYIKNIKNVAITYDDEPTSAQRDKLRLACNQTLFGLYEGIPLTKRGNGYNLVIPDKITIFKKPLLAASTNLSQLKQQVKHTLWHEIAHYYGLDHRRIHQLESQN